MISSLHYKISMLEREFTKFFKDSYNLPELESLIDFLREKSKLNTEIDTCMEEPLRLSQQLCIDLERVITGSSKLRRDKQCQLEIESIFKQFNVNLKRSDCYLVWNSKKKLEELVDLMVYNYIRSVSERDSPSNHTRALSVHSKTEQKVVKAIIISFEKTQRGVFKLIDKKLCLVQKRFKKLLKSDKLQKIVALYKENGYLLEYFNSIQDDYSKLNKNLMHMNQLASDCKYIKKKYQAVKKKLQEKDLLIQDLNSKVEHTCNKQQDDAVVPLKAEIVELKKNLRLYRDKYVMKEFEHSLNTNKTSKIEKEFKEEIIALQQKVSSCKEKIKKLKIENQNLMSSLNNKEMNQNKQSRASSDNFSSDISKNLHLRKLSEELSHLGESLKKSHQHPEKHESYNENLAILETKLKNTEAKLLSNDTDLKDSEEKLKQIKDEVIDKQKELDRINENTRLAEEKYIRVQTEIKKTKLELRNEESSNHNKYANLQKYLNERIRDEKDPNLEKVYKLLKVSNAQSLLESINKMILETEELKTNMKTQASSSKKLLSTNKMRNSPKKPNVKVNEVLENYIDLLSCFNNRIDNYFEISSQKLQILDSKLSDLSKTSLYKAQKNKNSKSDLNGKSSSNKEKVLKEVKGILGVQDHTALVMTIKELASQRDISKIPKCSPRFKHSSSLSPSHKHPGQSKPIQLNLNLNKIREL